MTVMRVYSACGTALQRVQELIETPVALVSTAPKREDTILVRDPMVD